MNPRVLRRFIIIVAVSTFVMFTLWAVVQEFVAAPPGDYEVRKGDILLGDRAYDEAIDWFDEALAAEPDHRGALMGRGIALLQLERFAEAEAEFTHLIERLTETLAPDDATGRAVLAGAYANRGILYDRVGRYEEALASYIQALRIDATAVEGPGLLHKIIYGNPRPASIEKRALYLQEQLALPEDQRLLRVPEIDEEQRMHKP
jgi:tetratricopeptide (TPR) repeat protein